MNDIKEILQLQTATNLYGFRFRIQNGTISPLRLKISHFFDGSYEGSGKIDAVISHESKIVNINDVVEIIIQNTQKKPSGKN